MSGAVYYLAADCAVLPTRAGMVVYKARDERCFRVSTQVGRWLARGVVPAAAVSPEEALAALRAAGILAAAPDRRAWSLNSLAPAGAAGWLLISALILVGAAAWAVVASQAAALVREVVPPLLWRWALWAWLPPVAAALSIVHEWGHVLALRALGGRAGRLSLRLGWPWATIDVGPFRAYLGLWQRFAPVAGGVLVEAVALGVALGGVVHGRALVVSGALVLVSGIFLLLDLLPTPWSDGGQLLLILRDGLVGGKGND